jgi:putative ABC transport system ATP-binding protein
MSGEVLVQATNLTKRYGSGRTMVRAVDDVTLELSRGELVLVAGPSGSGKTTLLSMLGALLRPTSGRIVVAGVEITALDERRLPDFRAREIGFVFQAFHLLSSLTAEENVIFPATLIGGDLQPARRRGAALLERLGLKDRRAFLPRDLSGGEKQRVAIARALINDPPIILADEPTGNLDSKHGQEVTMILHEIAREEGRAVLMVTHDPRVEEVADRILWLEDGRLRERREERHEWVVDPVCGMRVDAWTATTFTEHAGRRYAFCSERCKERFEVDPSRFAGEAPRRRGGRDSG